MTMSAGVQKTYSNADLVVNRKKVVQVGEREYDEQFVKDAIDIQYEIDEMLPVYRQTAEMAYMRGDLETMTWLRARARTFRELSVHCEDFTEDVVLIDSMWEELKRYKDDNATNTI